MKVEQADDCTLGKVVITNGMANIYNKQTTAKLQWLVLLTWYNLNPNMEKLPHVQETVG